jgi:hypothetical protein
MIVALALIVVPFILRGLLSAGTPRVLLTEGRDPAKTIAVLEKLSNVGSD